MHNEMASDAQNLAVASFRTFLHSEVLPVALEFRDRPLPKGHMRELTQGIAEFGLPGACIAEDLGGLGLARHTEAMLFEELARVSADVALCVKTNKAMAAFLAALPTQNTVLAERYLSDILSGRVFGAFCLGESEVAGEVTARREGDEFVLDGEQAWVANGHYADFVVVAARTEDGGQIHLLAERRAQSFVTRSRERIALNSHSTAQLCFSGTRVPASQVFSGDLQPSLRALMAARIDVGLLCIGLMRAALEASIEHLGKRPDAPQRLAMPLARMATLTDAARLLCLRAYGLLDEGRTCGLEVSMAKWYASEMAVRVCRDAVQLHGADGLTRSLEVERLAREAIALALCEGSTELHQTLIAQVLLGEVAPPSVP